MDKVTVVVLVLIGPYGCMEERITVESKEECDKLGSEYVEGFSNWAEHKCQVWFKDG